MNLLYKIYFSLPDDNYLGILGKALNRISAKFLKKYFDNFLPNYYRNTSNLDDNCLNNDVKREPKLIASLTSFPGRINDVWICIESLLRQTVKPDMIILWLAETQFPGKLLPEALTNLVERGLSIRWCDEDLHSHKKYFYVMQEYPDDIIVLLDDDFHYPNNLLENLLKMYHENSDCICATRVHKMTYNFGSLNSYRKWTHNYNPKKHEIKNLFFTSGAGTLFPPHIMPKETFDKDIFKRICFQADDVWLNMLAVKNNIRVITNGVFNKDAITAGKTQDQKLVSENVFFGGNDKQINEVLKYLDLKTC